ncbi:MAG TPA: TonB-dependent receptor [Gallionella sp.]|nr:MAG: TonB-dependent receptor [Gallionellales bacterium GWA2_54_124]HCI52276.1 TonB-dependent receptor [Gallionella sp.]
MQLKRITLCVALAFAPSAFAAESAELPDVVVTAEKLNPLPSNTGLDKRELQRLRTTTSDTARLLDGQPGVSLYGAGGVSSLPVIHGMADDRVRVKVDGMDLISACANHMNSPLSYIDPANVGSVKVFAGITPVSIGGDSIGGTIQVDSAAAEFARAGEGTLLKGQAGAFYRSNNGAQGGNLSATIAGENLSMRYTGSTATAKNYTAGADFKAAGVSTGTLANVYLAGNEVGSTQYKSTNHALDFGFRHENHLFELKLGQQSIPYQGFVNQRMDMLKNDSQQINLNYTGQFAWGALQARAYNEHTQHYMNFLDAKTSAMSVAGMPMNTDGKNSGFLIKGDVILSERDVLRVGVESQRYRMSDWWAPVGPISGMMPMMNMMTGGTFQNINNGQRDRLAVFGEWEARWTPQWLSQLGLRSESVKMDTGTVQGYNTIAYPAASYAAFNAANRASTDNNIDITALSRYTPDERKTFEFGFAQKTRSPNLYERFAWSTNNFMAMSMNNWVGDGNAYVGNLNLKPEVARTLSGSASWHDDNGFEVKVAPYYTHVQNYIDAARCPVVAGSATCTAVNMTATTGFVNLQMVNQSARLYGADISAHQPIAEASGYGSVALKGVLNYVNGKNLTTGDNLYHMMPLNAKLAVEQKLNNWTNVVEAQLVSAHSTVQAVRNELQSGGYSLLNLRSSYEWKQVRFDAGIDNLFNRFYVDPLGGSYLGQRTMVPGIGVPGMGRSINAGVTVKF